MLVIQVVVFLSQCPKSPGFVQRLDRLQLGLNAAFHLGHQLNFALRVGAAQTSLTSQSMIPPCFRPRAKIEDPYQKVRKYGKRTQKSYSSI